MLLACGGSSDGGTATDFSGNYTAAITNVSNDCQFATWNIGQTGNASLTVTQSADSVAGTVGGAAKYYYDSVLGSDKFEGTASGSHVTMTIHGTRAFKQGNCTYTVIATLDGDLSGDSLAGQISYTAATNGGSDCPPLGSCSSVQKYNASRPPKQ